HGWTFLQKGTMRINRKDIDKLFPGRTVISSIYMDDITQEKVMSFSRPVYSAGTLKGTATLHADQDNLKNIFYTQD
ncbi:GAPES1 domain-containing protein, partial [Salmonella enterica]|uniref:GAPES1 domain-containing protein n=1 Tax=Salmonella enterica TaxID=28901 RepID=UPI003296C1C4